MKEINVWYGDGSEDSEGNSKPYGPIKGELIKILPDGISAEILITDSEWLKELEFNDPYSYICTQIKGSTDHVRYDDYTWSYKTKKWTRFEILKKSAHIAQLEEQLIRNQQIGGSTPSVSSNY